MKYWIKIIIGIIAFIVMFYFLMYFIAPKIDNDCLRGHAEQYCLENNFTSSFYADGSTKFSCRRNYNNRTRTYDSEYYYFLDGEKEDCRIKDWFTFTKVEKENE